jgi:hypothetical protein
MTFLMTCVMFCSVSRLNLAIALYRISIWMLLSSKSAVLREGVRFYAISFSSLALCMVSMMYLLK